MASIGNQQFQYKETIISTLIFGLYYFPFFVYSAAAE
jgi:hypothetical protein